VNKGKGEANVNAKYLAKQSSQIKKAFLSTGLPNYLLSNTSPDTQKKGAMISKFSLLHKT